MREKERTNSGGKVCKKIGLRQLLTQQFTYVTSDRRSGFVYGLAEIFTRSVSSRKRQFRTCSYPCDQASLTFPTSLGEQEFFYNLAQDSLRKLLCLLKLRARLIVSCRT